MDKRRKSGNTACVPLFGKYLNKALKAAAAAAFMMTMTGCTFGTSIDNLLAPPKLSIEQEQIYNALTDAAGDSISLKYPKAGKYLSAFIVEDIDGDGGNEAVVFYEKTGLAAPENTLRINILDRGENGKWRSVYDTPAECSEIERVMISQLGENNRINLIIGSSLINRSEKTASIYSYSNGILEKTFAESYSFIDVTDLDDDGENEFLLLQGSVNDSPAAAIAYKLDKAGMYHRYREELSGGFTEFDAVSYGSLDSGERALYIDAVSGNGYIQTDIVYMDKNGLQKAFDTAEQSAVTQRPSGCRSFDVDGDRLLEIPVQSVAPGYDKAPEGELMWLTNWVTVGNDGRSKLKYVSYYSVGDGYIFIFPAKWHDRVTLKRDAINDEIVICAYENGEIGRELMRIYYAEDAASREDRTASGYMLLRTKGESAYLADLPPFDKTDDLAVTEAEAAIGFKFN
ncbi:MAG: hypothetical protein J6A57_01630 [Ruminococcus sp.]|nr:hypothetical protein [Ruminococcus sp.]